jgi:hypothetical protein
MLVLAGALAFATKLSTPAASTAVLWAAADPLPPQAVAWALPALFPIEWLLAEAFALPPIFVSSLIVCACATAVTAPAFAWVPMALAVADAGPGPRALVPP